MVLSGRKSCHCYFRRGDCSHQFPLDWARDRTRCVVCATTVSLSSLVIDGFDTPQRWRVTRGLCERVIATVDYH